MFGPILIGATALSLIWFPTAVATAQGQTRSDGADSAAFFRVVIAEAQRSAEGVLLVDPHEIGGSADLTSVGPQDVGPLSPVRERVLREMGIATTAFLSDQRCAFSRGLPPPPGHSDETQQAVRQQCQARAPFTSVIVGPPSAASGLDGSDTASVLLARVTTSSYSVHRYVLCRGPSGWRVLRTEELIVVQS